VHILLTHKTSHSSGLRRNPDTDSLNPWGSIEPRLRTTGLDTFRDNTWPYLTTILMGFSGTSETDCFLERIQIQFGK